MQNDNGKRNLYGAIGGAVLLALAAWAFWPTAVTVEMADARITTLAETVDAEGWTRVRRKHTITSPVSGRLKRIGLREGDNVPQNYLIAEVDPNPPIPRTAPTPDDHPNPYAAKIYTPAAGKILRVLEKSERFVEVGTPLLEVGDPGDIEIVADVLSTDAVRIRPGMEVSIENLQTAEPVKARVDVVSPQALTKVSALGVEEKRVDIVAQFVGPKPPLGDNYRMDVRVLIWRGENVLCIPTSALFASGDTWNVFVVEWGRAYRRPVRILHRSRTETEIIEGIAEGTTVILHPSNTLVDGTRVTAD
jgi:multidrug efflux pump subunit AcrA (membrane-fusion protein)